MTVVSIISAMTSSGNEKGPALWPGQSGVSGGSGGGLPSRLQPVPRVVEEGSGRHGLDRIGGDQRRHPAKAIGRSEEHTSELQSLMRISYAVFCLKKKKHN